MFSILRLSCVLGTIATASVASAATISGTVASDYGFSLLTGTLDGTSLTLIEAHGAGFRGSRHGDDGLDVRSYAFTTDHAYLYLAAWWDDDGHDDLRSSNDALPGVLAEFSIDGTTVLSGDPAWTVYASSADDEHGSEDAVPAIAGLITSANLAQGWGAIAVGEFNGEAPREPVDSISGSAQWMWNDWGRAAGQLGFRSSSGDDSDDDPDDSDHDGDSGYDSDSGHDGIVVFRTQVPEPGTLTLLSVGGWAVVKKARRARPAPRAVAAPAE